MSKMGKCWLEMDEKLKEISDNVSAALMEFRGFVINSLGPQSGLMMTLL